MESRKVGLKKKLLLKIVHLDQNQEIKSFIKNKSFLTLIK